MGSPRALLSKAQVTPTSSAAIPAEILATFMKDGTMAQVMSKPALRQTNLANEPADYVARRDALRLAEIELMRQCERVAELRRRLPKGSIVQDYVFEEGPAALDGGDSPTRSVRLSELFTGPNRSLVIYHFMYGKK